MRRAWAQGMPSALSKPSSLRAVTNRPVDRFIPLTQDKGNRAAFVTPAIRSITIWATARRRPVKSNPFGQQFLAALFADQIDETAEQIVRVLRTGRGLGVMLDREHRTARERNTAVGAIEQRDMGFLDALGQRVGIDGKAVVHRDDL